MTIGVILILVYWTVFTIRKGYMPKLAAAEKANKYDLNRGDQQEKETAQRRRGPITAAKWTLRIAGWAENALLVLMIAWLVYLIGALITGTFVVLGHPV